MNTARRTNTERQAADHSLHPHATSELQEKTNHTHLRNGADLSEAGERTRGVPGRQHGRASSDRSVANRPVRSDTYFVSRTFPESTALEHPPRIASAFLFSLAILFAALECFMIGSLRPLPHGRSLALGTLGVAFMMPELAIIAFLATLPVFGNKPATGQFHYFLIVQCSLFLGLFGRNAIASLAKGRLGKKEAGARGPESSALWTIVLAYGIASVLSLSSLPLASFVGELGARLSETSSPRSFAASFLSFVSLAEDRQAYAFLSCCLTVLSICIAGLIMKRAAVNDARQLRYGGALLAGLLLSFVAGILDYYRFIDLRSLRGLDPLTNPGNAQFRLQSFFGHSGWFAEYVTLTVPFVLLVLLQRVPYVLRVAQCLLILLVGEFVLILTYQRGGWVSYPLTLFSVWAAIYVSRRLEAGERDVLSALRKSFLKICLSLPITVVVSLVVISAGLRSQYFSPEVKTDIYSYVSRFGDIKKTSDRTDFMLAGYRIGALHPFFGAGSESFGYQFHREFELPSGHFPGELTLPFHGTAHTVYFQILSGKGVAGLTLLLVAVLYLIIPALRIVTQEQHVPLNRKVFLLAVACFATSFLIYGVVQEVFYIQCLQVLFFTVLGLAASAMPHVRLTRRDHNLLWGFLALMFALHLFWEKRVYALMNPDREEQNGAYGCYMPEQNPDGRGFRWCAPKARVLLPRRRDELGAYVELRLGMDFLAPGLERGTVKVRVGGQDRLHAVLPPLGQNTFRVPLLVGDPLIKTTDGARVAVDLEADTYFIPQFVFAAGNDYRMLSFRLYQ